MGGKCDKPNIGGIYSSIGYLIIDPPTPNIPDKNEPINPSANITIINDEIHLFLLSEE